MKGYLIPQAIVSMKYSNICIIIKQKTKLYPNNTSKFAIIIGLALGCQGNVQITSPSKSEAPTPCEEIQNNRLVINISRLFATRRYFHIDIKFRTICSMCKRNKYNTTGKEARQV
jgi:hypothetical protein